MEETRNRSGLMSWIGRLVIVAIILGITSFLTPGFSIQGLWSFLIAAVVITILDYAVERMMGVDASPFGKGIKGFVISAIILYVAQFLVPNMRVSMFGAIIAAVVIGIIDAIFPSRAL